MEFERFRCMARDFLGTGKNGSKICDTLSTLEKLAVSRYLTHLLEPNADKQLLIVWFSTHQLADDDGWTMDGFTVVCGPYDPPKHRSSDVGSSFFSVTSLHWASGVIVGTLSVSARFLQT